MSIDEYITMLRKNHGILVSYKEGNIKIKSKNGISDEILKELKTKKEKIVDFFNSLNQQKSEIIPVKKQRHYPLSHSQRRLWIMDQLVDIQGLYNAAIITSLVDVDRKALKDTFSSLIDRHEILRTVIHTITGQPQQVVCNSEDFKIELNEVELANTSSEGLQELVDQEFLFDFDLSISPIRLTLIKKSDKESLLIFVMHHIVTDGWSKNILVRDLKAFYDFHTLGLPLNLPDLKFHYKDYTLWQQEQLEGGYLEISKKYWINKFKGNILSTDLPLDYQRTSKKSYKGASVSFELPPNLTSQLEGIGKENEATLFMVLVSIIKVLLYRYCNQESIAVGIPVLGRDHTGLENQVGFYTNTVVLYDNYDASFNFIQWLSKVSNVMLEAYKHQYYPYDLLVDELELDRDISRNPLFDVMVLFDDLKNDQNNNIKSATEGINTDDQGVNKFDLCYSFTRKANGNLHIDINYDTDLFKKSKIIRMAGHLKQVVTSITQDAYQKISEIEYLTKVELRKVSSEFNDTQVSNYSDYSILELFEQRVKNSQNEICLISNERRLTFAQLNEEANVVACCLIENHGIQKGDAVGLLMDSSIERMVILIGVIKAGAIYVPIDTDFPEERVKHIAKDACLKLILTRKNESLRTNSQIWEVPQFSVDTTEIINSTTLRKEVNIPVTAADTLCILYTSGSTGTPKGVLIHHKGVVNRMQWLWNKYNFSSDDIIYQKTPFVFDVSMGELFMPLCFGAKLLIADIDSSVVIAENIIKFKVSYIHFSPTLLNKFLESVSFDDIQKLNSLRFVFSSGEALLKGTVEKYYKCFKVPLINLYGPTEASIEVSYYEIKPHDEIIPIGKPIANTKLYILDDKKLPVPIGIIGQIYIGGTGLSYGYLNQPELTEEKFISNPFFANEKIYETGDLGRWNENGEIEFYGRIDNQSSINGFRVEPGEIESVLLQHHKIKNVAVINTLDEFKNPHLVACFTDKDEILKEFEKPVNNLLLDLKQHQIIEKYAKNTTYHGPNKIDELIECSARKHKHRDALIFENRKISYHELYNLTNKLTGFLTDECQVKSGDIIGVIMNRSDKVIISILAILKSSAAYLPIDPDLPEERIQAMLKDAGVKCLITDQNYKDRSYVKRVNYNDTLPTLDKYPVPAAKKCTKENNLCYVCYTSGSTGNPKGVMVEHKAVIDYIYTFSQFFKLTQSDKVVQQSSIAFDTFVEEVFPTLFVGGTLLILPDGGRDINRVISALNKEKITLLSTTPLVLNELNERTDQIKSWPRITISGGDVLKSTYIDKIIRSTELYNTYGPTETTVCVTFVKVEQPTLCNNIGQPISNHKVYILNDNLEMVSVGEVGEMYIAGPGIMRGYLNKIDETDSKFVNNPFGEGKLYRTGDHGLWHANGFIEFKGRTDGQVKIKGYRMELAEVDDCLSHCEGIKYFITLCQEIDGNNKCLVTYYTGDKYLDNHKVRAFLKEKLPYYMVPDYFVKMETIPTTSNGKPDIDKFPKAENSRKDDNLEFELKNFLKAKLPPYMIPTLFRRLDEFPLTVSGKIDRKALSQLNFFGHTANQYVPPKNELQKDIVNIWEQNLKKSSIGINDNFFEVGGNSIKATQIIAQIFEKINLSLSLKDFYNNPTIAELSEMLNSDKNTQNELIIRLSRLNPDKQNIFLVPPIIGSSTIFKELANMISTVYNVYGLQYSGFDFDAPLANSILEMAHNFISQVKEIHTKGTITLMGYSMGAEIAFEMTKILESFDYKVNLILLDRGINKNKSLGNKHKGNVDLRLVLERELSNWFSGVSEEKAERVKKLVSKNLEILESHKIEGKVHSDIMVVEATQNPIPTGMLNWNEYTSGRFTIYEMKTNHYGLIKKGNSRLLAEIIVKNLKSYD